MNERARGLLVASGAAVISGVAVFLNARGVRAVGDATVYTTAKNLVAAAVLVLVVLIPLGGVQRRPPSFPRGGARRLSVLAIGLVGGSVPFVLFFEGLARESSTHAAFLQKTLLIWVALLAVPLLGERLGLAHVAAIALLVAGQAIADGGLGGFRFGAGEWLILTAALLWAVEVVIARRLLADMAPTLLGAARMVLGSLVLVAWVAVDDRWSSLTGLDARGWWWAVATGVILAGYVATWYTALSLAPAVDVTAVLSVGALVTAGLAVADSGAWPSATEAGGLAMLLAGAGLVAVAAVRGRDRVPRGAEA